MATEGGGADVRALLAEAGVAQYADALVAAGYDSLPNVLALDEAGLQDLKLAVNMLPGHFGFLRARIRSTTTAAPPPPAAPPPAAAAGPVPAQQAPRQARAPREDVLKMSSTSRRRGAGVAAADHARCAAESNSRAERMERRAAVHPRRQ